MSSASKAFESLVRDKLHRILREHNDAFLHYDAAARALVPYCWPTNGQGHLIKPSALEEYRSSHVFSYPGCFCAATSNSPRQTESVLAVTNYDTGKEYLVVCADQKCGYIMKAMFRADQPVLHFPHRAELRPQVLPRVLVPRALDILADVAARQDLAARKDLDILAPGRDKRVLTDLLDYVPLIPLLVPKVPTAGAMIYRLHSAHRPGLTFDEFRKTFVYCECGLVSTRRKHELHDCKSVRYSANQLDLSGVSDGEVSTILLRLDMYGIDLTIEMFQQLVAKCPCGMVMTKKRWDVHECL